MNDTLTHKNDIAFSDSLSYTDTADSLCVEMQVIDNQYKDFKFVTEKPIGFNGPKERELTSAGSGWNLIVVFVSLVIIVINKLLRQNRLISSFTSLQKTGVEKYTRKNYLYHNFNLLSTVFSFILLISMLIFKVIEISSPELIRQPDYKTYISIVTYITVFVLFNYLAIMFYGWILKSQVLSSLQLSLHYFAMSISNIILIVFLMIILFYPYVECCVIAAVLLLLIFIVRIIKLLNETRLLINFNFVNIFLYLCTIEILPLMVIAKMIFLII